MILPIHSSCHTGFVQPVLLETAEDSVLERIFAQLRNAEMKRAHSKLLECGSGVFREVYSYLSDDDQNQMHKVAEIVHGFLLSWSLFHRAEKLREYVRKSGFGAAKWEQYFGKVEKIRLPLKIYDVLQSPCPFFSGKKVGETHILVYVPQTVNGKPLTLNSLGKLVQHPKEDSGGNSTGYVFFYDEVKKQYGDQAIKEPCWILMTRDVIPESRNKSFDVQCKLIPPGQGYQVPGALEAVAGVFSRYADTGEKLLPYSPWTFANCQEHIEIEGLKGRVIVGSFSEPGLAVTCNVFHDACEDVGVVVLRKFLSA